MRLVHPSLPLWLRRSLWSTNLSRCTTASSASDKRAAGSSTGAATCAASPLFHRPCTGQVRSRDASCRVACDRGRWLHMETVIRQRCVRAPARSSAPQPRTWKDGVGLWPHAPLCAPPPTQLAHSDAAGQATKTCAQRAGQRHWGMPWRMLQRPSCDGDDAMSGLGEARGMQSSSPVAPRGTRSCCAVSRLAGTGRGRWRLQGMATVRRRQHGVPPSPKAGTKLVLPVLQLAAAECCRGATWATWCG